MKKIIKLFSIVVILFCFTGNVDAQSNNNKKQGKHVMNALNLTKQQKQYMKSLQKDTKKEKKKM